MQNDLHGWCIGMCALSLCGISSKDIAWLFGQTLTINDHMVSWCLCDHFISTSFQYNFSLSERTRPWSSSPLIASRDSFSLSTWAHLQFGQSIAYYGGCNKINFWYVICIFLDVSCIHCYYSLAFVGYWASVSILGIIHIFSYVCRFDYISFVVSRKVGIP